MPTFVVDEDMPRSTAAVLAGSGHRALDVRDCGLRGANDQAVFGFAQEQRAVLLTGDKEFGNILRYPLGTHFGIVVARLPNEMPTTAVNAVLLQGLDGLGDEDLAGNVVIIEPRKTRIRRPRK